jgi:O-antigen/teichoic acid export membrane protein
MVSGRSRLGRRLAAIASYSLNALIVPITGVLVSLGVVRLSSVELWGEVVRLMLIVHLAAHIIGWGNKEYFLRTFARAPTQIAECWQSNILSRSLLLVAAVPAAMLLPFEPAILIGMVAWCAATALVQAHEALIIYRRDFIFSASVQIAVVALSLAAIVLWRRELTVLHLVGIFTLSAGLRALALLLRHRRYTLTATRPRPAMHHLVEALPFFLLGLNGLLNSRIDLYCVSYYLAAEPVGQYQVFMNFMLQLQALAGFVLIPMVKAVYRLPAPSIHKVSAQLFLLGLIAVAVALPVIYWLLVRVYGFLVSPYLILWGGLFALPIYRNLPIIYQLYSKNVPAFVAVATAVGTLVSLVLNIILLPRVGLVGAIMASATTQWLLLVAYGLGSRFCTRQPASVVPQLP